MPNTLLFDLDGTLLDTLEDLSDAVNHVLALHSFPLRTLEQTRAAVGNGVRNLIIRSLPQGEQTPCFEQVLSDFRVYYAAHSLEKTRPYEGIPALLDALHASGRKVGIVSNKFDAAVKAISAHFFGDTVSVAIGEDEAHGVRKKPAPDAVFHALSLLGADAEDAVYIGDSEVDLQTARNAGIDCISVAWGFRTEKELISAGADAPLSTVQALAARLGVTLTTD